MTIPPELKELVEQLRAVESQIDSIRSTMGRLLTVILDKPVEDVLLLSARTLNALEAHHVRTVGQLVRLDKIDLLKFRNLGRKSVSEIETELAELGLELGMKFK